MVLVVGSNPIVPTNNFMKYLSLFSGIGGFEIAINRVLGKKAKCVGFSEIDSFSTQVYNKHFKHKPYGDIKEINPNALPAIDLIVGGFPCQAFSVAGQRKGFKDTRGTLFFEIKRIIRKRKPRLLLLENVKGLLSHDEGRTFFRIIKTLHELGYDCQWQVLNSKNFGVPQSRERVFIIGHLRGKRRPKVFPFEEANGETIKQINKPIHSNDRIYDKTGLSPTLNTMQGGNRQPFIAAVLTPDRVVKRQNGRRMKTNGEPSFTLTAQDRHGIYDGKLIRRLTPMECERLQGFPDLWTSEGTEGGMSDSQRYKQIGNAVTTNVVEAIIKRIYG